MRFRTNETNVRIQIPVLLAIRHKFVTLSGKWGHAVAQLFEALRYKPEGRGFDSR